MAYRIAMLSWILALLGCTPRHDGRSIERSIRPLTPDEQSLLDAVTQDWLDEFGRIQLILRTSARLRKIHGD